MLHWNPICTGILAGIPFTREFQPEFNLYKNIIEIPVRMEFQRDISQMEFQRNIS